MIKLFLTLTIANNYYVISVLTLSMADLNKNRGLIQIESTRSNKQQYRRYVNKNKHMSFHPTNLGLIQGSTREGIAKIPPWDRKFPKYPPPEFWDFQETPPSRPRQARPLLPKNGQFSRKFGHFVGHFR